MTLDVSGALKQPGVPFALDVVQAIAPQEGFADVVTFDPARLLGTYTAVEHGNVLLRGTLTTTARGHCANCLEPASAEIREDFEELFVLGGDPEDNEIFVYTGQEVDLERLALTTAVLGLPIRMLCREGCNRVPAYETGGVTVTHCQEELPGQRPFAALKQLLAEKTGEGTD